MTSLAMQRKYNNLLIVPYNNDVIKKAPVEHRYFLYRRRILMAVCVRSVEYD